jgi:kumamolisin
LAGTVGQFDRAFGVNLKTYQYADGTYRGRTGFVKIPKNLKGIVEGVFGLDNRPVARRKRPMYGDRAEQATNGAHAFDPRSLSSTTFPTTSMGVVKS